MFIAQAFYKIYLKLSYFIVVRDKGDIVVVTENDAVVATDNCVVVIVYNGRGVVAAATSVKTSI